MTTDEMVTLDRFWELCAFDVRAALNLAQGAQAMLDGDSDLDPEQQADLRALIRESVDRARQIMDDYDAAFRAARAQQTSGATSPDELRFSLPSHRSKPA